MTDNNNPAPIRQYGVGDRVLIVREGTEGLIENIRSPRDTLDLCRPLEEAAGEWVVTHAPGTAVTGQVHPDDRDLYVYVVERPTNGDTLHVTAAQLAPADNTPAEPANETPEHRADRIESEFAAFRDRVRTAVITEAEHRGWCEEVDNWLTRLGLPTRFGDMPRERYAVILLKNDDGGTPRIAIRHDADDSPWRIHSLDPKERRDSNWYTDAAIFPLYKSTIYAG